MAHRLEKMQEVVNAANSNVDVLGNDNGNGNGKEKLVKEREGTKTQYSTEGEELEWRPERVSKYTGKTVPGQYASTGKFDLTKALGYQP